MVKRNILRTLTAAALLGLLSTGTGPLPFAGPALLQAAPLPADGVVVYQFHRRFRCEACHILEATINETLRTHFAKELESGKLVFRVVDLDAEGNGHYEKDYDFFYNTVIMVDRKGGQEARFKNLEEVWGMVDQKETAMEFIRKHVQEYL